MYHVFVACSAGVSPRMLIQMIKRVAEKQRMELSIESFSLSEAKTKAKKNEYDLLLLGPQVSFMKDEMEKVVDGRCPVKPINQKDYGMMRADNILKDIIQTVDNNKG